jgi:membrane protein
MRQPFVLAGLDVQRAYDRGGGGMSSAGLSFYGFFSVVPALLLFASLLGWLIEDQATRDRLIEQLIEQVEPLKDVAGAILDGLAGSARTGTLVGIIGLVWGASGFYGSLQAAMQRMFPGPGSRDVLATRIRGVLSVALILVALLSAVLVLVVVPLVTEWLRGSGLYRDLEWLHALGPGEVAAAVGALGVIGVAILACLVVYVEVPPDGPTLRQALLPAVVAGLVIGLLTALFGQLAPLLVRQWLGLGVVGSVFVALVWFNLVFQVLLYGAAFAKLRLDRERRRRPVVL